jgi:predicted transcriptional regulator
MRQTNTKKQQQIEWRRNKINELSVKGFSQSEISRMLDIDKSAVSRDIEYLKQHAKDTIKNHIHDKLPYEYSKCISGLEEIIKEAWIIVAHNEKIGNTKDKLQSLALIKDTYNTKMDLLTNASLLQDSIKFVSETKLKQNLSNKKDNNITDSNSDIQGSTETNNNDTAEQFNQVF